MLYLNELNELLTIAQKNYPDMDVEEVKKAYEFAYQAHLGQKRASGEDYIIHPLAVAKHLAILKTEPSMIIAGLLHDVPEDTKYTIEDVNKNFGSDVAFMVDGVTKLGTLKYRGEERYIENLRRMFIAIAEDLRVVLIKFSDRLHSLETLDALPVNKQYRIALESLEIYAPIAGRLGIRDVQESIENLAFKYVNSQEYERTLLINEKEYPLKEKILKKDQSVLLKKLKDQPVVQIYGRTKHIYSLYHKLVRHNWDIGSVHDMVAIRIITKNIPDCYSILGVIHQIWKPLRGRVKDYIAQPKPNGYSSLHTTVFDQDGHVIEVQIRTKEMEDAARYGILAHWYYKTVQPQNKKNHKHQFKWIDEIIQRQHESTNYKEYLQSIKNDIFKDHIFVFTPRGDVIDLPYNATPIDFAYTIHSDLGHKCISAIVNNQIVSLDTKLRNNDVVKIITNKQRKYPNADWLQFVKTKIAGDYIRRSIQQQKKQLYKK